MVSIRSIATALVGVALLAVPSSASSVKRNPVGYATTVQDALIRTPGHRVHAYSEFELFFLLHDGDEEIRLKLEPNHDVLDETFAVTHLGPDGKVREIVPVDRSEHRVYRGHAFTRHPFLDGWSESGWARITVHRDGKKPIFEGAFRINDDVHHIQTGGHYHSVKHEDDPTVDFPEDKDEVMVVWRDSDILPNDYAQSDLKRGLSSSTCSSDALGFNSRYQPHLDLRDAQSYSSMSARTLFGRQSDTGSTSNNGAVNLEATIGSTSGCPTTRKVALIGVATDCTYTGEFNSSSAVRKHVINMVNEASQLYESSFNISLGIQNLTISDKECPGSPSTSAPWNQKCSNSVNLGDRLNLFSSWRGEFKDSNAYWTLLTTCTTDSAVGLAWLGQLCRQGSSSESDGSSNETVASANVVVKTSTEWEIFAHESGHIFGAVHDCTSSTCPVKATSQSCCPLTKSTCDANGKYIMNPATESGVSHFSPCTIGNICSGFKRNIDTDCLTDNKNVKTITGSQCGNGIVEEGEECDCGGEENCSGNTCCDAKTCKFTSGSVCDPGNEDCCSDKCQFASSSVVCRASTGNCDPAEKCTGKSASCPKDQHLKDGTSCGSGGLKCASGQCTSRDQQCITAFGNQTNDDTSSCDSSGCTLSCKSPTFGYNVCAELNQNFLDGTSCGGGGKCNNGQCKGSSVAGEIRDWYNNNKNIAIPVTAVVGALILFALLSCLCGCMRRCFGGRRRIAPKPRQMQNAWPPVSRGANPNFANPGAPPPPPYSYAPIDSVHMPPQQGWQQRQQSRRYA